MSGKKEQLAILLEIQSLIKNLNIDGLTYLETAVDNAKKAKEMISEERTMD